jgi:LmbE family N-acetylglucosaminyl deacetylase
MKKAGILIFFSIVFSCSTLAQPPVTWSSSEIYQAIRKLNVLGSVLYVAAHPDDENGRLITYFSKDKLYRTGYLSFTRGDGGQNLIGNEQGIELGLIRTQELLAARRIDGGEQFFTRAYDFGYSKTPEETFTKWDRNKILSDVVWVIRSFQPDVIITRFPTTGEGGHGHHTASGILANEAFVAAADPTRFPEQLKFVRPWQAKRIFWNTFNFGGNNLTSPDQFKIDVGGYNPLLGKSYGEIAAESRSQHKSQGFGASSSRGETFEYFKTTGGPAPVNDIHEDIDISWSRIQGASAITKMADDLATDFDFLHPDKSIPALVKLYKAVNSLSESVWKVQKLKEIRQLIEQCSGLFLDATAAEQFAVQSDSIRLGFTLNNRLGTNAKLLKMTVTSAAVYDSTFNQQLLKNKNLSFSKTFYVSPLIPVSQPYWLENKMEEGYFTVNDQLKIGKPDTDASFITVYDIEIEGEVFRFTRPVKYKLIDPVKGEMYHPLVIVPPLLVSSNEELKISTEDADFTGVLNVTSRKKNLKAFINDAARDEKNKNATIKFDPSTLEFPAANTSREVNYTIRNSNTGDYKFWLKKDSLNSQTSYDKDLIQVKYDHIPFQSYFKEASVSFLKVDLKTSGKKIAYIPGAGDKIPEALEEMGFEVNMLTEKEISRNKLDKFDAIITGVRAYNTNEWLNKHYDKLMKYVQDGGNLIVQYNTSTNLGPVRARISPYNFNIARTRVTDENAPVTILKPGHPVMNFPNKITNEDFKGWIQERSIYHATGWDSTKFETVLSFNDPGEKPDEGSLIIAKHGKGYFTYTGLVFFRQLPAGVPGAYRLLANLIALNRKKAF